MEMTITATPGPSHETNTMIFGGKDGEFIRHIFKIYFALAIIYELFEQS